MTINQRLMLALVSLLLVITVVIAYASRYVAEKYVQEINQQLNASLAMYVVDRLSLMDAQGRVNTDEMKTLAAQAMTINPSAEVYLLDTEGQIIAHGLPENSIQKTTVDLVPVQHYLQQTKAFPIAGTDPRTLGTQKAFSVAPIIAEDKLLGYLYVVLGGKRFDSITSMIEGSYVLRLTAICILALVISGLLVGAILFRKITAPLEALTQQVSEFTQSHFHSESLQHNTTLHNTKEVKALDDAFVVMATKIHTQLEQLQENDQLRRELVANVSHDLRTPLANMQGYIETLLIKDSTIDTEKRRQYLAIAHKHTKRLNQLISALFELSKLDAGVVQPNFERFSLTELLQDTIQEFELIAQEKQINISLNDTHEDVSVVADIGLIQRVLENLLHNALRHTPSKGRIRLTIGRHNHEQISVSVADTGSGIGSDELEGIFDRFARGKEAKQDNYSMGLGLAIVKRILELHGTQIHVTSEMHHGSEFSFILPQKAA